MYTMILLLYLQHGLDVTLDQANLRGEYRNMAACEAAARTLRGPVPIPHDLDAAWQDAMCIKVNSNVRVNAMKPVDLGALLQAHPPLKCQAEGAWARVAEMCRSTPSSAHDTHEAHDLHEGDGALEGKAAQRAGTARR